jgi:DNA invertase Pin-like site-specific DNA recombinase
MPIAYSYSRFSSEKQSKGDSLRRQRDLALQFIERNPELELELDTTLNLTDEGLSAYKGVAQTKGALGAFIRLVMEGTIEKGSYLLVESLDRLSRQTPRQALNQLNILADEGIVLVTLSDNKVYTKETLDEDGGMSLMFAIMLMSRAHEESQTKSLRISAAWANKFNKIKDGVQLTARVPFWINKADKSKTIDDKVAIVKEVFRLSASGLGSMKIAQELNDRKFPTPSGQTKFWALSSVKKILASEAVLGTLVTADGQRHEKYYPEVINSKLWLKTRYIGQSSAGARGTAEAHPLSGLMFCKHCGATAQRSGKSGRVRQDGTKNNWKTLVCAKSLSNPKDEHGNAKSKKNCEYRSISYDRILNGVKSALMQLDDYTPTDEIGKQLKAKRHRAEQIQDLIDMVTSPVDGKYTKETPTSKANLAKMFMELDGINKEIAELEQVRRPTSQRLFEGARKAILGGEVTNALMRQTIKKCDVDFKRAQLDVYGHDGHSILGVVLKDAEELKKDAKKRLFISGSRG